MNCNRIVPIAFLILIFTAGCAPAASARLAPVPTRAPTGTPTLLAAGTPTRGPDCISLHAVREQAVVTKVVDGDTIDVVENGVPFSVRYVGVDAPELAGEPMAEESRAANERLLAGQSIVLIRDQSEADRYGRLLRFVFAGDTFVNLELVRLGLARATPFPPDLACQAVFAAAQAEALQAGRGVWSIVLSLTPPGGGGTCAGGCVTPPAGCLIKGNISAGGEKIYHVPGGKFYAQTVIEPEKGERWFCTEAEAVAAGWRKSKQ